MKHLCHPFRFITTCLVVILFVGTACANMPTPSREAHDKELHRLSHAYDRARQEYFDCIERDNDKNNYKYGYLYATRKEIDEPDESYLSLNYVIPPQFDEVKEKYFLDETARVAERDDSGKLKWFLINEKGNAVSGKYNIVGEQIFRNNGYLPVWQNKKVGLIKFSGEEIIAPQYDELKVLSQEGDGLVKQKKNGKFRLATLKDEGLTPFIYDDISDFQEGVLIVKVGTKRGYISDKGRVILSPRELKTAYRFSDGVGVFTDSLNSSYIVNKEGLITGGPIPTTAPIPNIMGHFHEGLMVFTETPSFPWQNKKKGYMDKTGKTVIAPKFDTAGPFHYGVAVVGIKTGPRTRYTEGNQYGLIDKTGEYILPLQPRNYILEMVPNIPNRVSRRLVVGQKNGWYQTVLMNTKGEILSDIYQNFHFQFFEGIAIAKKDGKYAYMNANGELITPLQEYSRIDDFKNGEAKAWSGDILYRFDKSGQIIEEVNWKQPDKRRLFAVHQRQHLAKIHYVKGEKVESPCDALQEKYLKLWLEYLEEERQGTQ